VSTERRSHIKEKDQEAEEADSAGAQAGGLATQAGQVQLLIE